MQYTNYCNKYKFTPRKDLNIIMKQIIADNINILSKFCGKRDIKLLTKEELQDKYSINQVDVMVLFGGSILCGGDVLATAMRNNIAKKYIIVGGAGHTTDTLRSKVREELPKIETEGLSEAEIFSLYLKFKYNLKPDLLECNSTNCGNNITNLLDTLETNKIDFNSIILVQDSTMQYRMEAGLRKYVADDVKIINYAAYEMKVTIDNSELVYENDVYGMWDINHYITLLMGEIPRLTDDKDGYGPNGKDYIVHVDIPSQVEKAFLELKQEYKDLVRKANPLYASKNN